MSYDALSMIKNRHEMYEQLDQAVNNIGEEESDDDSFSENKGKKYLKALTIESNAALDKIKLNNNLEILPTSDASIKVIKITSKKSVSLSYLDTLDDRFWILYSLDNSPNIKREVNKLIGKNNSKLDYSWFSSTSLQILSSRYSKTNFSMKFNNKFGNSNIPMKKLSIRLWAEDASDIIQNLFNNEYIGKGACLSNIEVLLSNNDHRYIKTRLATDGSINVSKGNSFDRILEFQQDIIQRHYKPIVKTIERDYTMNYKCNDNGIQIKGNIVSIKLREKVDNIENVTTKILKGTNPFRFMGFSNKIDDDDYLLNVIDLHNFSHFDMEIFPDEILVNLPKGACGNSIMRLYALCQETIDPRATLTGGEGHAIISAA